MVSAGMTSIERLQAGKYVTLKMINTHVVNATPNLIQDLRVHVCQNANAPARVTASMRLNHKCTSSWLKHFNNVDLEHFARCTMVIYMQASRCNVKFSFVLRPLDSDGPGETL